MEKLIVKNFGAIQKIDIQLKDLTVFIGETGTGKSTLAKLVSIIGIRVKLIDVLFTSKKGERSQGFCVRWG